jgi:hypothetical protein
MLMKKSDDDALFKKRWIYINATTKTLHWAKSETTSQSKCILLTSAVPVTVSSMANGMYSIRIELHASSNKGGLVISELSESVAKKFKDVIDCISGRS